MLVGVGALAASASADFTGWTIDRITLGNGHTIMNVYANFDNVGDRVINVYSGAITTNISGGFFQGTNPFWQPGTQNANTSDDSWVCIGTNPSGSGNASGSITSGDPRFINFNDANESTDFSFVEASGRGAGWYNNNPGNTWGFATTGRVLVAHFVAVNVSNPAQNVGWNCTLTITRAGMTGSFARGAGPNLFQWIPGDPDGDGDGVNDLIDNCVGIYNPDQADCNDDGVGDACEIAGGAADDNGNHVPDQCECGAFPDLPACLDCNRNGIPDFEEIADGSAPDCNMDGVPDTCQGAVLVADTSGDLGAPSGADARSHQFAGLAPASSGVELAIDVRGDLNGTTEWIDVTLNGSPAQRFFQFDGSICPESPDRVTIELTAAEFNALLGGGDVLSVVMSCPGTVDGTECKESGLTEFSISYLGIGKGGDCNGNLLLDICETFEGSAPDCNGNGLPDSCDLVRRVEADCNGNGVPDSCDIGRGDQSDCNGNGQIDSCEIASGNSPDIDGNGVPDECQTVCVPVDFAGIQPAIDAASSVEMTIIKVLAGTYAGPIDFKGKPVIVRGAAADETIISGTGGQPVSVVQFSGGEPPIAALERFTVTGGLTGTPFPTNPSVLVGGGLFSYNSAASVRECTFEDNIGGFGGGMYLWNTTGAVADCIVRNNHSGAYGGGIHLYRGAPVIRDTLVESNFANARGGGMHIVEGNPVLVRVVVHGNSTANIVGGVSWVPQGVANAYLQFESCVITGNTASVGQGGIGIIDDGSTVKTSLLGTTVCDNAPFPNVVGLWSDIGGNDVCICIGDVTFDGAVNGADLGILLSQWGPAGPGAATDLNGDGTVNGADLGLLLAAWGPCRN